MARFVQLYWKTLWCIALLWCSAAAVQADGVAGARLPGKFVWAELATDNLPVSQRFYGDLFGWTFTAVDGYVTAFNGEQPVAGLFYRERPRDRPARPRWIAYVSVDDLSAATRKVEAAGGRVRLPPGPMPGLGERVVYADVEGALFGAVSLRQGDPEDYLADTGSWIWLELLSRDVQRAAAFYHAVGDYELFQDNAAGAAPHYVMARDGYARAAILPLSPKRIEEGVQPMWLPFIRVDNVKALVSRVTALGGKVVVPPRDTLYDGRMALIEDPAGTLLGVMEWDADESDAGGAP